MAGTAGFTALVEAEADTAAEALRALLSLLTTATRRQELHGPYQQIGIVQIILLKSSAEADHHFQQCRELVQVVVAEARILKQLM